MKLVWLKKPQPCCLDQKWSVRFAELLASRASEHSLASNRPISACAGPDGLLLVGKHANPKYKYGNRHFWARGYYVDTVGRNKKQIQEYIRNQLTEDQIADQIGMKEFVDPFTGSVNKKA